MEVEIENEKSKEDDTPAASKYRGTRGPTTMAHLKRAMSGARKKVVQYNKKGQPIGREGSELQSYIGVLARSMVPITYERWSQVPKELKEEIYSCVEMSFVVDPKLKKNVISSACTKWRGFKCKLTNTYILPFKDQPEVLESPPKQYNHIKQEHWDAFAQARLSEEFLRLSRLQRERRAKNIYNHRMSRKGYAGLEEDLKKSTQTTSDIDRSTLWKVARLNKNGEFVNVATEERAKKIDELTNMRVSTSGSNDVLTMALGTPEHPGRVRGVGGFVSPMSFFHPTLRTSEVDLQQELEQQKHILAEHAKQMETFKQMWENGHKALYEKISQLEAELKVAKNTTPTSENGSCPATSGEEESKGSESTADGDSLEKGNALAAVDTPVCNVMMSVREAVGALVKRPTRPIVNTKINEQGPTKKQKGMVNLSSMPIAIKAVYRYAELVLRNDTIPIKLEEGILGYEHTVSCSKEDLMQICEKREISVTCIVIYIGFLYVQMREANTENLFVFLDPLRISTGSGTSDERARYIYSVLEKTAPEQYVFAPFNIGSHWMLFVIDAHKNIVYMLNPIIHGTFNDLKEVINTGIKIYKLIKGSKRGRKLDTTWKTMKSSCQPGSAECGYYVLRFMREIIADQHRSLLMYDEKVTYTTEEIDEIRVEWAEFVGNYI